MSSSKLPPMPPPELGKDKISTRPKAPRSTRGGPASARKRRLVRLPKRR
jgi:hypothetical protein